MGQKLFVGNLSYKTTGDDLRSAFEKAGTVEESVVITDKMSGRSKGFGFVTMSSDAEANSAIEMWNQKELDGRSITVNEARPMQERSDRDRGDRGDRGGRGGFGGGFNRR